jgi:beta-RFAP synthase
VPRRQFGGVGLMIDKPGIDLTVEIADQFSADGPLAERALRFAQTYCDAVGIPQHFRIRIDSAAPEHVGLGTGTQLGLAVARGIAELADRPRDAATLAQQVGRGKRSAIGIHGFERGGFLVEAGKTAAQAVSPLIGRWDFPEEWSIVLLLRKDRHGTHGPQEIDAFAKLAAAPNDDRATEALSRIVLLGMIPAIIERDFEAFGEALYDYNRRAGEMFQEMQGGIYSDPRLEELFGRARDLGVKGFGQSSWGPTAFFVVEGGADFGDWLQKAMPDENVLVTSGKNVGALVQTG